MNVDIKDMWVKALRSGEYEQGVGALCENGKYCCLGVLADIASKKGVTEKYITSDGAGFYHDVHPAGTEYGASSVLPHLVLAWAYMEQGNAYGNFTDPFNGRIHTLTAINDADRFSFDKIADIIDYFGDTL